MQAVMSETALIPRGHTLKEGKEPSCSSRSEAQTSSRAARPPHHSDPDPDLDPEPDQEAHSMSESAEAASDISVSISGVELRAYCSKQYCVDVEEGCLLPPDYSCEGHLFSQLLFRRSGNSEWVDLEFLMTEAHPQLSASGGSATFVTAEGYVTVHKKYFPEDLLAGRAAPRETMIHLWRGAAGVGPGPGPGRTSLGSQ